VKLTPLLRGRVARLLVFLPLLALVALILTGCGTDTPQNTFAPEGPVAGDQRKIFLYAMWPAIAIMILVEVGLVVILLRFRRRRHDEVPKQTHGNTPLEIGWTVAPAILLAILGIPMLIILFDLGRAPRSDAFVINVTGHQWLWQFEYPSILDDNGDPVTTQGEFHFPAGREIAIHLRASDVIHSFAIPRLAGTRDAIPSADLDDEPGLDHVETMWIRADKAGTYAGQCREFCGLGHADMKIVAHADSQEDFEAWVDEVSVSRDPGANGESVAER
jgi:cytochrome c oxidase subunit 2